MFKVISIVRVIFLIFSKCYTIIIILNIKNIRDHYPIKNNRLISFLIFL